MLTGTRKGSLQNLSSCHLRAQRTVRPATGTSSCSLHGRLSIAVIMHYTCLLLASTHPLCRTAWITSLRSDLFMGAQVSNRQPCAINKFRSPGIPQKTGLSPHCVYRGVGRTSAQPSNLSQDSIRIWSLGSSQHFLNNWESPLQVTFKEVSES